MDKNKMFYITLVLAVCVVLTGIGCFYLGTKFGENNVEPVKNVETIDSDNETNKDNEEVKELTKEEKDELVKNEVEELVKLLNYDYENDTNWLTDDLCWTFGIDRFDIPNEEDLLSNISTSLMSCRYGLNYKKIDNYSITSTGAYLMTTDMYKAFQEYFNVSIDENKIIDGASYYVAYVVGDGFGARRYNFDLVDITENSGVYTAEFDIFTNNMLGCYVGKAQLNVSIRDNHIYYESFKITDVNSD